MYPIMSNSRVHIVATKWTKLTRHHKSSAYFTFYINSWPFFCFTFSIFHVIFYFTSSCTLFSYICIIETLCSIWIPRPHSLPQLPLLPGSANHRQCSPLSMAPMDKAAISGPQAGGLGLELNHNTCEWVSPSPPPPPSFLPPPSCLLFVQLAPARERQHKCHHFDINDYTEKWLV